MGAVNYGLHGLGLSSFSGLEVWHSVLYLLALEVFAGSPSFVRAFRPPRGFINLSRTLIHLLFHLLALAQPPRGYGLAPGSSVAGPVTCPYSATAWVWELGLGLTVGVGACRVLSVFRACALLPAAHNRVVAGGGALRS